MGATILATVTSESIMRKGVHSVGHEQAACDEYILKAFLSQTRPVPELLDWKIDIGLACAANEFYTFFSLQISSCGYLARARSRRCRI